MAKPNPKITKAPKPKIEEEEEPSGGGGNWFIVLLIIAIFLLGFLVNSGLI